MIELASVAVHAGVPDGRRVARRLSRLHPIQLSSPTCEQPMTLSGSLPSVEPIVDAMIKLARAAKSHRVIVAGSDSAEVLLELHRRGYLRVTTTKTWRAPCDRYDVVLVTWREHSIKALATTLDWLVHFLSDAGVVVVWISRHERMLHQTLRLALERLGFRIESATACDNGVAVSARRLELNATAKVACGNFNVEPSMIGRRPEFRLRSRAAGEGQIVPPDGDAAHRHSGGVVGQRSARRRHSPAATRL